MQKSGKKWTTVEKSKENTIFWILSVAQCRYAKNISCVTHICKILQIYAICKNSADHDIQDKKLYSMQSHFLKWIRAISNGRFSMQFYADNSREIVSTIITKGCVIGLLTVIIYFKKALIICLFIFFAPSVQTKQTKNNNGYNVYYLVLYWVTLLVP